MAARTWSIIGLSGTTNSGKSTIAAMLCRSGLRNVSSICQDSYFYGPNDPRVPRNEQGAQNWEDLGAMDMDKMMKDVNTWIKQQQCNTERSYLIIEGFLIFNHRPLATLFDKKFFIKIDMETCLERRRKRTYNPPDYPGYFENVVWPMYLKNLDDLKDQDDIEFIDEPHDLHTTFEYLKKAILGVQLI